MHFVAAIIAKEMPPTTENVHSRSMRLERVVRVVDLSDHHLTKEDEATKRQNDDAKVIGALILNGILHLG